MSPAARQSTSETIAAIADSLPAGIWVATVPSGALVYSNKAFADILGMGGREDQAAGNYSQPYGICDRSGKLYPEDKLPFALAMAERRTVVVDDLVIHRRDGTKVDVRATAKPLFDYHGEMFQIAIAFFDITRERAAERAREEVEHRLRTVLNVAPIILWATDQRGVVTVSEGRALSALGVRPGELVGRSVFDLYANVPDVHDLSRRALAGETATAKTEFGSSAFEAWINPIRDEAGNVTGAVGVATDVTEQRKAEAQLVHADRLASMGRLAASVAHEINSPLHYVLASLDLALERIRLDEEGRAHLEAAREGAIHVQRVAEDLRRFARPDFERTSAVDLRVVIASALRMSSVEIIHRARVVEHHRDLPAVDANEAKLAQVFLNLILNAAQAIPEGNSAGNQISITTFTEAGWAVVEIADTGTGIAPADLPRIFEPFYSTKPSGVGSGLGLSVSKTIIDAAGGTITVESTVGKGSLFRVRLPPSTSAQEAVAATTAPSSSPRARILIVDDDRNLARTMAASLDEHETRIALDGGAALAMLLGGQPFDLVFCDLMMRDMSGMELYERLQSARPGLERKLVIMTGGAFTPRAREFLARIPNPQLEKPFDARKACAELLASWGARAG